MYKNEKSLSFKNIKIKEDLNKNKKYTKIKKNFHHENSIKEINKNMNNKYLNKLSIKEKVKSQKQLKDINKVSKNIESNNRNMNRIDITMNFNLTNFTTYNETNKMVDKKLIENYSGKKEVFHKRQISDGFQKIKVINTGNFVNIKVNTKENKTSTNKEIQNMKKIINKNKMNKNNYINYDIEENDKINNTNNFIYNSHKDLSSFEKISKLKINVSDLSNQKDFKKISGEKKINKINNNLIHMNTTKSALNLNKKEKEKEKEKASDNANILNNIPIDRNIFTKKIMINNRSFKYKKLKNPTSESIKNLKTDTSKKILITNAIKEKMIKNENETKSNCDNNIVNDKKEMFPLNINSNSKKIIKYNINNSCEGLNNITLGKNLYKKVSINLNNTSRNNTNRERESTNFFTEKRMIEDENIPLQNKDKENIENNPEMDFFNIVKLIQKSKNSVY